jgi:hypothetical protein
MERDTTARLIDLYNAERQRAANVENLKTQLSIAKIMLVEAQSDLRHALYQLAHGAEQPYLINPDTGEIRDPETLRFKAELLRGAAVETNDAEQ